MDEVGRPARGGPVTERVDSAPLRTCPCDPHWRARDLPLTMQSSPLISRGAGVLVVADGDGPDASAQTAAWNTSIIITPI